MAEGPQSGSSSDSDSSDTFSLPDVLEGESFPLASMDSSSDDSETKSHTESSLLHIKVRKSTKDREHVSRYESWRTSKDADDYFQTIIGSADRIQFFPNSMATFLTERHDKLFSELTTLDNGVFFIYLARSLIVTLNVDNPRVRVPSSLVFDACIFSKEKPVAVISVFRSEEKTPRMELYNTFVARGVTEALRTWSTEDISVTNCGTLVSSDLKGMINGLWQEPGAFHIPSSLHIWKDKAMRTATALLRSVSVASCYPLLYPDKGSDNVVWFLTKDEFESLTNNVDLLANHSATIPEGDKLVLATELCLRQQKRYKTALVMAALKDVSHILQEHLRESYRELGDIQNEANSRCEIVITDLPLDKMKSKHKMTIVFYDEKESKLVGKETPSLLNILFNKKKSAHQTTPSSSQSSSGKSEAVDLTLPLKRTQPITERNRLHQLWSSLSYAVPDTSKKPPIMTAPDSDSISVRTHSETTRGTFNERHRRQPASSITGSQEQLSFRSDRDIPPIFQRDNSEESLLSNSSSGYGSSISLDSPRRRYIFSIDSLRTVDEHSEPFSIGNDPTSPSELRRCGSKENLFLDSENESSTSPKEYGSGRSPRSISDLFLNTSRI